MWTNFLHRKAAYTAKLKGLELSFLDEVRQKQELVFFTSSSLEARASSLELKQRSPESFR